MAKPSHSPDAQWFLSGGCALGERGVSEGMLNVLIYGPSGDGVHVEHTPSDAMLGWGTPPRREGEVARARRCWAAWRRLSPTSQAVLLGRYTSRQWPPGVAGQLGELAGVVVVLVGSRNARRRIEGATARLVECSGLRWTPAIAEIHASAQPGLLECDWSPVVATCQGTSRDAMRTRAKWLTEAGEALGDAVEEWQQAARNRAAGELELAA